MDTIPNTDKLITLGDFNAKVGADLSAFDDVLGRHGLGQYDFNCQFLIQLCIIYNLNITNTNFLLPIRIHNNNNKSIYTALFQSTTAHYYPNRPYDHSQLPEMHLYVLNAPSLKAAPDYILRDRKIQVV